MHGAMKNRDAYNLDACNTAFNLLNFCLCERFRDICYLRNGKMSTRVILVIIFGNAFCLFVFEIVSLGSIGWP